MNKVTDIMSFVNKHDVKFIRVSIIDILGEKRSVEIPVSGLSEVRLGNIMCDSSSIKGGSTTADSDRAIEIDESSAALACDGTLEIYGSLISKSGEHHKTDSRYLLYRQSEILKSRGYILNVGLEPEFYLLNPTSGEPIDSGDYFSLNYDDLSAKIRRLAVENLMKEGYLIGPFHHEEGPGQCEINFAFSDALTSADRLYRYKEIIKGTAKSCGAIATFCPKPFEDLPGSGMHLNCSLSNLEGVNLFYDKGRDQHISRLAMEFVSGILYHAPAICALACATDNSYSRLHCSSEAPSEIFWSFLNRRAAIRIPSASRDKTRIEVRFVDNTANLYLLLSAIIAAGLDGIDHPLKSFDEDRSLNKIKELPRDLKTALSHLLSDELLLASLGRETLEEYSAFRSLESPHSTGNFHLL